MKRHQPTILDFFPTDEIDPRTWTIREHSRLKRQWRALRRMPYIVQFIVGLFALTWFTLVFCATLLVVGGLTMAHADSICRQRNAEIAFCLDESNQYSSRTAKSDVERLQECLRANGWAPGSGSPKVLPDEYVRRIDGALGPAERRC